MFFVWKFLIINNGLHRIGIVLGALNVIIGPPLLYDNFGEYNYFWLEVLESAVVVPDEIVAIITIGSLIGLGLFLLGYFTIKVIEWIYRGFNKKDS